LALVAERLEVELGDELALVRVSPERCELTGGSDIRAAFQHFVAAARSAGLRTITIVGGSTAYRKELRQLAEQHAASLRLNLVSGTQRRTRRRAEADIRTSDLVVIWGATELNHSVSAVYKGDRTSVIRVPHRGISRMLEHLAESIAT